VKVLRLFPVIGSVLFTAASLHAQTPTSQSKVITCSQLTEQILRCPKFGFAYKIHFGWVDRTEEMQQDSDSIPRNPDISDDSEKPGSAQEKNASAPTQNSETLLAIFERPPGALGETINSAVVVTAEPLANYPKTKTAADYFGAIGELAEQRGFTVVNQPHTFSIGMKQLVRGDFSKERGKLIMYQSSLVILDKSYFVSFTFVGGSEDEVEELIENLSFGQRPSQNHGSPK
jgi:hypothetical protein